MNEKKPPMILSIEDLSFFYLQKFFKYVMLLLIDQMILQLV